MNYNINKIYLIQPNTALKKQAIYPPKRKTGWIKYLNRGLLAVIITFTANNTSNLKIKIENNIIIYKDNKTTNILI